MPKNIEVVEGDVIEVRRRNTQVQTEKVSITLPKDLNQTINNIVVRDSKSRSFVIAELLRKGLRSHE